MGLHLNFETTELLREKWKSCRLCGSLYAYAEIFFDSGSVEPTVDETLTGDTSTHTGVVVNVTVTDGAWADTDAEGWVEIDTLTGADMENWTIFQDDETVTGSTGGSDMFTVDSPLSDQKGFVKQYGILHPKGNMIKAEDGFFYCTEHYSFRFDRKHLDAEKVDSKEWRDRGKE